MALDIPLEVRAIYQALKVSTPTILGVQALPVGAQGSKDCLVPNDLAVFEEVQVNGAAL